MKPVSTLPTKKLAPEMRSTTVEASFQTKLEELRRIKKVLKRNPRSKIWRPLTLEEFRGWEEEGKFRAWSSKTIDSPGGPYPTLVDELAELLRFFNQDPLKELQRENDQLVQQNRVLATQIVEMESVIRSLVDELVLAGRKPIGQRSNVVALYRDW
ncbi:hypothetical protein A6U86_19910 [Rhizobium sp. AC27/96]|uniref:hypothetical protein n=1 Tax=Rhizobium sp. AC27/96 TaxID=1841653 RepID=UPI000828E870|nr:hypothetical protein [Rhizobium sp. AC27/96]OCI91792.1 hypothetical protein A6U86_19910 [Rhizobium sp. AC27/96]